MEEDPAMRTRHLSKQAIWLGVGATALVAAGCTGTMTRTPTRLSGMQEVPAVATAGSGTADISIESFKCPSAASSSNCPTVLGTVSTVGIRDTGVQIRQGGPGQVGPVIVTLERTRDHVWSVSSGTTLSNAQ